MSYITAAETMLAVNLIAALSVFIILLAAAARSDVYLQSQQQLLFEAVREIISQQMENEIFRVEKCAKRATIACQRKLQSGTAIADRRSQLEFSHFACAKVDTAGSLSSQPGSLPLIRRSQIVDACRFVPHGNPAETVARRQTNQVATAEYYLDEAECLSAVETLLSPLCALEEIPFNRRILLEALDLSIAKNMQIEKHKNEMHRIEAQIKYLGKQLTQNIRELAWNAGIQQHYFLNVGYKGRV